MVIINKITRVVERFEPQGSNIFNLTTDACIWRIQEKYNVTDYQYRSSPELCLKLPQDIESNYSGEQSRNCAVWSLLYLETRLLHPELTMSQVVDLILDRPIDDLIRYINEYKQQVLTIVQ